MKKFLSILLVIVLIATTMCGIAVAFDGNDYDYGGGFDFDSGDSDSGDLFSLVFLLSKLGPGGTIVGIIIVIIVIILKSKAKSDPKSLNMGKTIPSSQGRFVNLPDRTTQIETIIKQNDPNFSSFDFVTFAKEVYIDVQTAWCNRDLTPVRPVMHENLYNTTARQVQSKIDQGVVYHYESIAINTAYLTSYAKDSQFEYLTCYLNARMIDYQVDEKTGNIIRGDKSTRWDMRYKMKFVRSVGAVTKTETGAMNGHNCPNCGAPLEITSTGICEYCGSVVTTGQYSWVLTDFTTVRDDTVDEGIKGV